MWHYPVSLSVSGRRCVVVGGGKVAERKALGLLAAGASVVMISPDSTARLEGLREDGTLEHIPRSYREGDLDAAYLAILATDDIAINRAAGVEARRRNVIVNVADDPTAGNFALPAVLRRGDLVMSVSTNGRSPAAARYIRDQLSELLTAEHLKLLEVMADVRAELVSLGQDASGEAWRAALDDELLALVRQASRAEVRTALIERLTGKVEKPYASDRGSPASDSGVCKVSLVGAGPGDPGLITVRGLERLRHADVVVYDHLVDPALLEEAPREAELIYVGKLASRHTLRQTEINTLLIAKAREGKQVVRLKGGDPFVFGRGGEEAQELRAAGVPFEVVPGVTSAVAVPAYAGIPLTHRACASSFAVVTGHEDPSKPASSIAWDKLATGVDTLVCLMGAQNLSYIVEQLLRYGRSPETPVALIRWGTWPAQDTVVGTIANIEKLALERQFGAPAIAVVGEVVRLRDTVYWLDCVR